MVISQRISYTIIIWIFEWMGHNGPIHTRTGSVGRSVGCQCSGMLYACGMSNMPFACMCVRIAMVWACARVYVCR